MMLKVFGPLFLAFSVATAAWADTAAERFEAAIADLTDTAAVARYLETLPRIGDRYVIDGDILATRLQVLAKLDAYRWARERGEDRAATGREPEDVTEILLDLGGALPADRRALTYAIDRESFSAEEAVLVESSLERAIADWIAACEPCDLSLTHLPEHDDAPDHEHVDFIVTRMDDDRFYATAFFPTDAAQDRYLRISTPFFDEDSPYDPVGVMRHELGHVFGYRHEHIRSPLFGCLHLSEDDEWTALTPYDATSAMHYPCDVAGSRDFALTDFDREAHRTLYGLPEPDAGAPEEAAARDTDAAPDDGGDATGEEEEAVPVPRQEPPEETAGATPSPVQALSEGVDLPWTSSFQKDGGDWAQAMSAYRPAPPPAPPERQLVIEFIGPTMTENLFLYLNRLREKFGDTVLGARPVPVNKGDSACGIYEREWGLRGCPRKAAEILARTENETGHDLVIGQDFYIPDIPVETYDYRIDIDSSPYKSLESLRILISNDPTARDLPAEGETSVVLKGRRITLDASDREAARAALDTFYEMDFENATLAVRGASARKDRYSRPAVTIPEQAMACRSPSGPPPGQEAAYWTMIDRLADWTPPACALSCEGDSCPQIVLPDSLAHPHSELENALVFLDHQGNRGTYDPALVGELCEAQIGESPRAPIVAGTLPVPANTRDPAGSSCRMARFDEACHHSTSMSGIMASAANETGFLGLAPGTTVYAYDWLGAGSDNLRNLIARHTARSFTGRNGPQIFVFASKFPNIEAEIFGETNLHAHRESSYPKKATHELRFDLKYGERLKHSLVKEIVAKNVLWITAAGQPESPDDPPWRLDTRAPIAPMNLGDLPNVLVVTGCDSCDWPDITLAANANYARSESRPDPHASDRINLAAPGSGYLTPGHPGTFVTEHGGTSQAAAFVGGVAAGMLRCNPAAYLGVKNRIEPDRVKRRLMLTSIARLDPDPSAAETAGVIDPEAALLDPDEHWGRLRLSMDGARFRPLGDVTACTDRLDFAREALPPTWVSMKNLRRLVRVDRSVMGSARDRWFVYTVDPALRANVNVIGPVLIPGRVLERPFLTAGGAQRTLADLDEVIFADDGVRVDRQACR